MSAPSVRYIPVFWRTADGKQGCARVKAAIYGDGTVLYELRRVVMAIVQGRKSLDLHKMMKRDLQEWVQLVSDCGFDLACHIIPGLRVLDTAGSSESSFPNARKEWQVSGPALLILLAFLAHHRRKTERNGARSEFQQCLINVSLGGCTQLWAKPLS